MNQTQTDQSETPSLREPNGKPVNVLDLGQLMSQLLSVGQSLGDWFVVMLSKMASLESMAESGNAQIQEIQNKLQQLTHGQQALSSIHADIRDLLENSHRKSLILSSNTLIVLAGRKANLIAKTQKSLEAYSDLPRCSAASALHVLLKSSEADLIEIEGAMDTLGLEAFIHPDDVFNPHSQSCIKRINTSDPELEGKIASRILPGYRRCGAEDELIRREIVEVYVIHKGQIQNGKDEDHE